MYFTCNKFAPYITSAYVVYVLPLNVYSTTSFVFLSLCSAHYLLHSDFFFPVAHCFSFPMLLSIVLCSVIFRDCEYFFPFPFIMVFVIPKIQNFQWPWLPWALSFLIASIYFPKFLLLLSSDPHLFLCLLFSIMPHFYSCLKKYIETTENTSDIYKGT